MPRLYERCVLSSRYFPALADAGGQAPVSVDRVGIRRRNCVIILSELMISTCLLPVTLAQFLVDSQNKKYAVT